MLARVMVLVAGVLLVVGLVVPGAALAGEGCPNEQLRAENNSLGLPDCRAYEQVTPVDKNSALVEPAGAIAADGSSLAGNSVEGFAGAGSDELRLEQAGVYRFVRSGSGWVTTPLNPYRGKLESLGVSDSVWGPAEQTSVASLRLRAADGVVSEIGPVWPPALGSRENNFAVASVAAEAVNGVVFITEPGLLWPFDSPLDRQPLYEYKGTGNVAPTLVGVSGGAGSTALISQCGTQSGGISEDGGTVFFSAVGADQNACGGTEPPVSELFARIDEERTVAISEPSTVDCPSCDTSSPVDASFQGASADGSKVFFTTKQPLLGADTSESLYVYDFDPPVGEPRVARVSGGDGSVSEPVAEVQGVMAVSQDGSHVYFHAKGVLTTAANGVDERAQPGGDNLYVWERDAEYPAGHVAFVTGCSDVGGPRIEKQVTPDGRFLLFTSACHLTAGDTSTARQVFQYDAQTGSFVRVSIGLEGFNDDGNVTGEDPRGDLNAGIAGSGQSLSDDGSFVFFQSPVGLTPGALNEVQVYKEGEGRGGEVTPVFAQNVYEYHDGRVSLIGSDSSVAELGNDGAGGSRPVLFGVSASGGDVFFRTADQLVPGDTDTQMDFYDARVGGGFAAPVVPVGCVGEGCQGAPSGGPVFGAPSSAAFAGGGNLVPVVSTQVVVKKGLTVAQKLARALTACARQPKRKRVSCRARAKRLYGHSSRAVKSDRRVK